MIYSKLQLNDLPIHLPYLPKGFTVQVAVAVVTSKGLQARHVGKWMSTLSGKWCAFYLKLASEAGLKTGVGKKAVEIVNKTANGSKDPRKR